MIDWNNYSKDSEDYNKHQLLRIGGIGVGGGLSVGVGDENKDNVFAVSWDSDIEYEFLANNIFDFMKNLAVDEDYSNMQNVEYSQLYKNWGEYFWRIRENA